MLRKIFAGIMIVLIGGGLILAGIAAVRIYGPKSPTPTATPTPTPIVSSTTEPTLPISTSGAVEIAVGIAIVIGLIMWKPKILHLPIDYVKEIGIAKPWGKVLLLGIPLGIILLCLGVVYAYKLENPKQSSLATPSVTIIHDTPTLPPMTTEIPVITDTPIPTDTFIATATPIPIWIAAKSYNQKSPEILVPNVGLSCTGGIKFQIDGNSLDVMLGSTTYSITSDDPLFVSGSKWAMFLPKRWGVTYLDLSGVGQSRQIAEVGWIVDNRGCILSATP
jgi:hypothetical protein